MANPLQQSKSHISESEQTILKKSRDDKYEVLAVMLLGEDGSTARRVNVDSSGSIISGEALPTDGYNPSMTLIWTSGNLTGLTKTIGSTTYEKTLSYTGGNLTGITAWSAS